MTHHAHDRHDDGGLLPHGDHADDSTLAELLDLDPEALAESWSRIRAVVAAAVTVPPSTVVDLGAGTGTGSLALARLFPSASVVAVDVDPAMPERVAATTAGVGAGRVRSVVADLDRGWPDLGPVDLVWASMALHHLGDPDRTLRELTGAVVPGGLLVAVEFDAPVRVLAEDAEGGVEDRAHAALTEVHHREVPELGTAWAERFAAAGFVVETDEAVTIDVRPPLSLGTPAGIADAVARGEVHLRGHRTVTVARRP
jgi:SAM-dependent methyltransferase